MPFEYLLWLGVKNDQQSSLLPHLGVDLTPLNVIHLCLLICRDAKSQWKGLVLNSEFN